MVVLPIPVVVALLGAHAADLQPSLDGTGVQVQPVVETRGPGGEIAADPVVAERCVSAASSFGPGQLVAAFAVPAANVARWQATRHGVAGPVVTSEWADHPPDEIVAVCYLDGDFGPARGPAGLNAPNYDRVIVLVGADGRAVLDAAGWKSKLPVVDPAIP